jgi:nitronate monooxygenase
VAAPFEVPPVVQAGMGGGIAPGTLAAAVTEAGGLGTIGFVPPAALRHQLGVARQRTRGRLAVNVIVPLARREHWLVAAEADVVVTHWEPRPRRRVPGSWIHTVGSADAARAAIDAGADAVIAQGVESGGHVVGTQPALELLAQVLAAVPAGFPVLLAGGIAARADVQAALAAGAVAAVAGTRFLASEESGAHPAYKARVLEGTDTVMTELFGMGWPHAPHRVLPNDATRRWLQDDPRGPKGIRALHRALGPLTRRTPWSVQQRLMGRPASGPFDLTPAAPTAGMSDETVETHALYAGATVARVNDLLPAAQIVRDLTP